METHKVPELLFNRKVFLITGVKARGRPRRAYTDDLKDWTEFEKLQ